MTPDGEPILDDTPPAPDPDDAPAPVEALIVTPRPEHGWRAIYGRWMGRVPRWARDEEEGT